MPFYNHTKLKIAVEVAKMIMKNSRWPLHLTLNINL